MKWSTCKSVLALLLFGDVTLATAAFKSETTKLDSKEGFYLHNSLALLNTALIPSAAPPVCSMYVLCINCLSK